MADRTAVSELLEAAMAISRALDLEEARCQRLDDSLIVFGRTWGAHVTLGHLRRLRRGALALSPNDHEGSCPRADS